MRGRLVNALMAAAGALALARGMTARAGQMTVDLPVGVTQLGEIGLYTVTWQSRGAEPVAMPLSWSGHFDGPTGVSYMPNAFVMGRQAILLHSPWRVPPGRVWVDYEVALPDVRPIRLGFSIAMRDDVVAPDRSDGVTFSAHLLTGAGEAELLRRHYARAEWVEYEFDLSQHAGRRVTLRLQTEPGPANDPGWDYSYFGEPTVTVGTAGRSTEDELRRVTGSKAYLATKGADLRALANDRSGGALPSNILPFSNSLKQVGEEWRFAYDSDDCRVVYSYVPRTGTLNDLRVSIDDGRMLMPASGGGVKLAGEATAVARGSLVSIGRVAGGDVLQAVWRYKSMGGPVELTWRFGIRGKALMVEAECESLAVAGLSLGGTAGAAFRRRVSVPYLPGEIDYLAREALFACRYLDWTVSNASRCPQGEAVYEPKTDGTRNALHELGYIALSPHVGEVLPNVPHPPSGYGEALAPLVVLDVWGWGGTDKFARQAANLRLLKDNGVDHLAVIQHVWQRFGYDVKLPDHIPANPAFGGDEGLREFGRAARECGYLWSLHENYIDLYPDAPSFDPSAVVLRSDGSRSPAWFNEGTGVQSFGLKCNRALGFARQNSPEIHERYGTDAAYLDVHTCVPPWHQLDHDAAEPMAAMARLKVLKDAELFQYMRDTHGGPLFGEGSRHFYWAGLCDGVEAQVEGGEDVTPLVDFDLLKLHPQMVNHGMGYYSRWLRRGREARWGIDVATVEQIDKYRAQELAFGHAGFIGEPQVDNVQWVAKEHHLMHPVQRLYADALVTDVAYEVAGRRVSTSAALAAGAMHRQCINYDSGLTLWVNWGESPWQVGDWLLPQWGFLARGPRTEVATFLAGDVLVDYASCPEYTFIDARTHFDMPYLAGRRDIEPRVGAFEHLGSGRCRITYEWDVDEQLDSDYKCFVHFTNPTSERGENIEFQNDHAIAGGTRSWQAGRTVVDGPHEFTVPPEGDGTYEILVGLYDGERLGLRGRDAGHNRVQVGRLEVRRTDGTVAAVRFLPAEDLEPLDQPEPADFSVRLNPTGSSVNLGPVATDGCVKVVHSQDGLTIFPYPRDREFEVELDLAMLAPDASGENVGLRALEALTQRDLGAVPFEVDRRRLRFAVGLKGAGRYVLSR